MQSKSGGNAEIRSNRYVYVVDIVHPTIVENGARYQLTSIGEAIIFQMDVKKHFCFLEASAMAAHHLL
ncbi:MAG: hypothetical protein NHB32_00230 [Fischerella sp. CENA71]|nr:hypothetical protein [Fischerella sp. CENA71]